MYFFVFSITYHSLLEFFRNSIYILRITINVGLYYRHLVLSLRFRRRRQLTLHYQKTLHSEVKSGLAWNLARNTMISVRQR